MFYVKSKMNGNDKASAEIAVEITDENVFTRCPSCGAEIPVDIVEEIRNGDFDLFGTAVYCNDNCLEAMRKKIKSASC